MKVTKKNMTILLIVAVFLFASMICINSFRNKNLNNELLETKLESKGETSGDFAIMVSDETGKQYEEFSSNEWPNSDEYAFKGARCVDINDKVIPNIMTFDPESSTIEIDANSSAKCTLYFDKKENTLDFDSIYPVGSIYINTTATDPSTLFGGTWTKIEGQFLLGSSSTYALGSTGGEATHTLTVAEMPSHSHPMIYLPNTEWARAPLSNDYTTVAANGYGTTNTSATGGSQPHNNMPPYIAVSIWQRTA